MRKIFVLLITPAVVLLTGCQGLQYMPPQSFNPNVATITGSSSRQGGALSCAWINIHVMNIDNLPVSYPFFEESRATHPIPVTPNIPHQFTIEGVFNKSCGGDGPFDGIGSITATLKPGEHYILGVSESGAKLKAWIQTATGVQITSPVYFRYQIKPQNNQPIFVSPN